MHMGMQILKHWACTLDVYQAQPLMDTTIYSFWWGSHVWHYESKFILELVYIVSVSREIFKIHGRQR